MTSYRGGDRSCAFHRFLSCWALRLISEGLKDGQQWALAAVRGRPLMTSGRLFLLCSVSDLIEKQLISLRHEYA